MKTTLKIKLAPTEEKFQSLLNTMERFNAACDYIAQVAFDHQLASKFKLQKIVYDNVREQFGLSAQLTIRAIAKVVDAYKRDKSIRCTFKSYGAVVYDERIMSIKGVSNVNLWTLDGRKDIPMIFGDYQRTHFHRAKGQTDLILVGNTFYLLATLDIPEAPPIDPTGFIGVDLGIVKIATDSTGEGFSGNPVEDVRQRYHNLRRALQKRGGKNAARHLKIVGNKESRYRKDLNHCIAKHLVEKAKDTQQGIGLENLKHIRERVTVRKSDRAKHSGWSFYQLQSFIQYKAKIAGVPVIIVDARNSSRECSACGHIAKANRKTQAEFSCISCGHAENADHNASKVISKRAQSIALSQSVSTSQAQANGTASPRYIASAISGGI